jgi:hypothetical protein
MTIQQLSRLSGLKVRITYNRQQLDELRAQAEPKAQIITNMPHAPGTKDIIGELVPRIIDLERKIEKDEAELQKIKDYINGIKDPKIQTIFILRFFDGLQWSEVAFAIGLRRTSADTIKKTVKRYLENN